MNILEYVIDKLDKDQFDCPYTELYNLIFESESISMGGLRSIHFQIAQVYPRRTIDTERVNDLLREVR